MRPWLPSACLALLCLAPAAAAEEPPAALDWQPLTAAVTRGQEEPPAADGLWPPLGLELLLGLPTEVRFQAAVVRREDYAVQLEASAGLYVILPLAGVGARFTWSPWQNAHNALQLGPGVGLY